MLQHVERGKAATRRDRCTISTPSPTAKLTTTARQRRSFTSPSVKAQPERYSSVKGSVAVRTTTETVRDAQTEDRSETFNWFRHWWPVQLIYNLDIDRPNRVQLLDEYFVIWKSKKGEWVAMRDMCPHRLAPLSEGRIEEDGTLMCSYHGWRFDTDGKCVKIPQADDEKSHEAACNSPRSCAMKHPCEIRGGFVWIWPDHSATRFVDASASSIGLPEECIDYLEDRVQEGYSVGFTATVPYGYDVLMENVIDPSHVPFAHHGVGPSIRRSNGGPFLMKVDDSNDTNSIARVTYKESDSLDVVLTIRDCSSVFYIKTTPSKKHVRGLAFFASPITVESCRVFVADVRPHDPSKETKRLSLFQRFIKWCPWYIHLVQMTILDGDNVFLHTQHHYLHNMVNQDWSRSSYFLPSSSDLSVALFRKWLDSEGNGGPLKHLESEQKGLLPRRQLLDRYQYHVSECKLCQSALRVMNRMVSICKTLSRGCLLLAGVLVFHGMQHGTLVRWRVAAVFAALAVFLVSEKFLERKVLPQFHFVDYIHAEKN